MGPAAWAQPSQAGESWVSVPPPSRTGPGGWRGGGQACTLSLWGVCLLPPAVKLQPEGGLARRAQHVGRSPARRVTGVWDSAVPGLRQGALPRTLGPTSKLLLSFRGTEFPGGPEAHPLLLLSPPT